MKQLASRGVGSQVHYIPVLMHPYYEKLGFHLQDYPETEKYYNEALTLPVYYDLSIEDQELVIESMHALLK